jgi:Terminase large subunit, T4likevirus-type, N-terminal/Terminase RNAseH like domain
LNKLAGLESAKKATLDFKPHSAQEEIAEASLKYRYVVVRAGRRFGKSALALNIVLREAVYNPGRYWIIAPEYTQAKSIYWRDLVSEFVPKSMIIKKNDNELILEIMTSVPGKTSIIEFKGSDREDKLRGAGLKGVILDEYAFQKETVWDKIVGPMLVQTNGWAIFITTPNGVSNHFKKFWDDATAIEANQDSPDAEKIYKEQMEANNSEATKDGFERWKTLWKTFHFTSYDNPLIKKENLDAERARLTEEFFTQEYMAEFAKFTGLIYTEFDEKRHVQDFEIQENWTFYRAIDFGATDPNAVPFIGVDKNGIIHIFDEIYINELRTSEFAELIKQKSAHRYFVATYADSAGKQLIMDLAQYGVYSIPVKKNTGEGNSSWIIAGINRIQQLLKENKIIVHPRCKGFIKEIMSYSWRIDRTGEAINLPQDKNNHLLDAFRYFVVSYKGGEEEHFTSYLNKQADPITGY